MELCDLERILDGTTEPSHIPYSLLLLITENFSPERCIDREYCGTDNWKVRHNWTDDKIISLHPSLDDDCIQEIKKCFEIGLECVQVDSKKRPFITDILDKFGGNSSG
ncbi:hypothetical protein PR202_gb13329 [Eleusine coracana subsp. coracana]|uniref:Uncharacterized protein n=1 Tax=Eleusine coracana subsp. coracana TaxID=191504 RepID=A0AAV5ETF5_ELECO|nr:hypothetical protein PR202_gb13329 [Eleusine coracana subsp. coracana]